MGKERRSSKTQQQLGGKRTLGDMETEEKIFGRRPEHVKKNRSKIVAMNV